MPKFLRFTAILSIALITLTPGCSSQQPQAKSSSITPTPTLPTQPAPSPITPEASSSLSLDPYQVGSDKALGTATISQSAQSKDDWSLVASMWDEAIALMKAVPKSSSNYALAQNKVKEYQRNLAYAKQQAVKLAVQPASSPDATVVQSSSAFGACGSDLACNKSVLASGYWEDGVPEKAVDNDSKTAWRTSESTGAWMYVDLGGSFKINMVILKWAWDPNFGTSAQSWIEVSNDAQNWQKVATSTIVKDTRDQDQTLRFSTVEARYVRFYGARWNGGWAHLRTLKVYHN